MCLSSQLVHKEVARQLALVWGVYPIVVDAPTKQLRLGLGGEENLQTCVRRVPDETKDVVTITAGLPSGLLSLQLSPRHGSGWLDYWFDINGEKEGMMSYVDAPYKA